VVKGTFRSPNEPKIPLENGGKFFCVKRLQTGAALSSAEGGFTSESSLLGVEVAVEGVYGGLQDHMAVGTSLKVASDLRFDRRGESSL
jgi:hypothetical protein